jgi:LysM repeat protein
MGNTTKTVNNQVTDKNTLNTLKALQDFTGLLAREDVIRLFVDGAPGMGHQASSVRILRALTGPTDSPTFGFAYAGTIEVYYLIWNNGQDTLQKLYLLLPELNGNTVGKVNNATVNLIPMPVQPPAQLVAYGFTGGADNYPNVNQTPDFATQLNVLYFLRLQPYMWASKLQLQTPGAQTELTEVQMVGGEEFYRLAYYQAPVPEPVWNIYFNSGVAVVRNRSKILNWLVTESAQGSFDLFFVYGVRYPKECPMKPSYPEDVLTTLITSVLQWQWKDGKTWARSKSAVIVNLDEFVFDQTIQLNGIAEVLNGGYTRQEVNNGVPRNKQTERTRTAAANRAAYFEGLQAPKRTRLQDGGTLQAVQAHANWLSQSQQNVLFLQLGPVPPPIFDYVYAKATLPRVFEGMGTANLALSLGEWYFHVAQPDALAETLYPTVTLSLNNNSPAPSGFKEAANQISRSLAYGNGKRGWDNYRPFTGPHETLAPVYIANFMQSFFSPEGDEYKIYLEQVRKFYSNRANCKLRRALIYLTSLVTKQQLVMVEKQHLVLAQQAAEIVTLEQLYNELDGEIKQTGKAQLIPGILSQVGAIGTFYNDLMKQLNSQLLLDPAKVEKSPGNEVKWVKLSGTTTAAIGPVDLSQTLVDAVFEFKMENERIASSATFTQQITYSLDNVPWIQVQNPFLQLTTIDGTVPVVGRIGATLPSLDLKISFRVPAADGIWLFTGDFEKPISLASVYQLVGGVNLQQSLPGPFAALTTLGVIDLELLYDINKSNLNYITVNAVTDATVSLLAGLSLESLAFTMTVISPLTLRQVKVGVSGDFKIGTGPDAGVVRLSGTAPELVLQGQLVSGVIKIEDLLNIFLPGATLELPSAPNIDAFSFNYVVDGATWSVACNLNINWTISDKLTIKGLGLSLQNLNGVQGMLSGTVIILPQDPDVNFGLLLTAQYLGSVQGWIFSGTQTSGQVPLGKLLHTYFGWNTDQDYGIDGLSLTFATKNGSWVFTGKTAEPWEVPFISGMTVLASLVAGYNGTAAGNVAETLPAVAESSVALSAAAGGCQGAGYFGRLETEWNWNNIDLKIWFDYCPEIKKFGITWGLLEGMVIGPNAQGDWVASLKFTEGITLGSMVETMVSWMTGSKFGLEAPWNFLDSIKLSNLALNYTFNKQDSTRNHVSFSINIGPIDMGFARIDSIDISYQSAKGVLVKLQGSFPWNIGADSPGNTSSLGPWDASKPGTAPAPPGNGNKYFDLRLLAMGQHVTLPCFKEADTVQKAIDCMKKMPEPKPGEIPPIEFDAQSSWLIGTEFGVLQLQAPQSGNGQALMKRGETALAAPPAAGGYFLTMQMVFNDPHLYALRIKLDGEPAKIFKGLDFQIMYRQISETVGVYQAEITLPDVMRHLSIGAYSITLPVFGIAIYTNGDFQVDIGFPWNQDFSRSFTIEGIIYPGIPVMGSAGFYFGKLSSATTNKVPQIVNGTFNPVIVFGFGMQIGFGKSIQYGVLSAGFSLTVVGILEGVIAKFNPYQLTEGSNGDKSQVQGAYYFWLRGTIGIIGKLYGTVDFAIIKANVRVEIKLLLQLTYESFVSISITVTASVDVSVSIEINLGIFSFSIDFSFSMRLKETFTMKVGGTPPWQLAGAPTPGVLRASSHRRLRAHRETAAMTLLLDERPVTDWANLEKPNQTAPLTGYLAPALTMAHDEWQAGQNPLDQLPCYVAVMVINSVPPANQETQSSALKAAGDQEDTSFETLCKTVLCWVIAAIQGKSMKQAEVEQVVIEDTELSYLLDNVLVSRDSNPTPIPLDAVQRFLSDQFRLKVKLPDKTSPPPTTYFPVAPALSFSTPKYGDNYPGYSYTFAEYNSLDASTLTKLRTYFDDLAVQVEREMKPSNQLMAEATSAPLSMASWILTDYFLLIARQMVQAARDALRDFKYPIQNGQTCNALVRWINETGQLTDDIYTLQDLFAANPAHALNSGKPLLIGVTYRVGLSDTFDSIAQQLLGGKFTAVSLATANAANNKLLSVGAKIMYPQKPDYTVQSGDTLVSVAQHFGVRFSDLLVGSGVLEQQGLLAEKSALVLPYVTYQSLASDSFTSIAQLPFYAGAFSATDLATQNAGASILQPGAKVTYKGKGYEILAGDCLGDVATFFGISLSELLSVSDALQPCVQPPCLLAPVAMLIIPPFTYRTTAADDLQSVAAHFGVTLEVFGEEAANGEIADLFATVDSSNKSIPYLDIPHLPKFQVGELIKEAQRALALQHLSGMASRYYLHGMRLPTTGIKPNKLGIWVKQQGVDLTLPPHAGLYALTGQQFSLPVIQGTDDFKITLDRSAGPDWLLFDDEQGKPINQLVISIAPDSQNARSITSVESYAQAHRLDVRLTQLGAERMYDSQDATYPFTSALVWQSADAVTLPYGTPPAGLPYLRLWKLPNALVNLPNPTTRAVNPRFAVCVARYDEATGATVQTPVSYYGWASTIAFTVKRVPIVGSSPSTKTTYEVVGAGGSDIVMLERLLNQVKGNDGFFDQLILGYQPSQLGDATQGVQTDPLRNLTLGIAQVNLSTETRPPSLMLQAALDAEEPKGLGLLNNSKSEFVRLLWEASITRAGGFYLYYYNADAGGGLPDRIFNDKNEAALTLILTYSKPASDLDQNRLTDFMNAVVTGESIDTTNSVVFGQAQPPRDPWPTIPSSADDSLSDIAYRYYADVGDLAEANASLTLTEGKTIIVSEGVYQAPVGGISLSTIASNFGTTVAGLQSANPRWQGNLPDPLPFPVAIWLPRLALTTGTSAHTSALGDIASYYGENLTSLAASNRDVKGIFATNQQVSITGGPRVRNATVPPGVQAVAASRPMPPGVPANPQDEHYGEYFLLNAYSLLNYSVAENVFFQSSNMGLPAGPTTSSHDSNNHDKIRQPKLLVEGDPWDYNQALPFPKFAKSSTLKATSLPDLSLSPYLGIGSLLQVAFDWQDYYGNTLVTTLSAPQAGDPGPYNQSPMLTGYTDQLIGLSQWPSVASSWQVLPGDASDKPRLELLLSFDASRYQGLLLASASNATTVLASFTDDLDASSAGNKDNYKLGDITIQSAALSSDQRTVQLTVSPALSDGESYTLAVSNVKAKDDQDDQTSFSGQATFNYQAGPNQRSSTVQENATQDLRIYSDLYYQLNDANGIAYSIQSSLLKGEDARPGIIPLSAAQVESLLVWLFEGDNHGSSIFAFIYDRSTFGATVAAPPSAHPIVSNLESGLVNDAQVFELSLSFLIARTGGIVLGDLETTPGIRQSETTVAPLTKNLGGSSNGTVGLNQFAQNFESALSSPGSYLMKVATGINRAQLSTARNGSAIWAVRLGLTSAQPISYAITPQSAADPAVFAPQPISNKLQTRKVDIYDYASGQGISSQPTRRLDFVDIDMDVWGQQFFSAIDGVLMPEFTAAIQIVDKQPSVEIDYLQQILDQKKRVAQIAKLWMIPVFKDASSDTTAIREAFYQQLLSRLMNAYTTRAGIQYTASVNANIQDPLAEEPPRLFGSIVPNGPIFESATADPGSLNTVSLLFNAVIDAALAQNVANYSVSGGLEVQTATRSGDGSVVVLGLSGEVVPGSTTVTASNLKDVQGRDLKPPLVQTVLTTDASGQVRSEIGFTSPKLALASGTQPLPFLLTASETVRGAGGQVISYFDLNLIYEGAQIEHQIGKVSGIEGYLASSWLSFVIQDNDLPLEQELGQCKVPLILRSFPASPTMTVQSQCVLPASSLAGGSALTNQAASASDCNDIVVSDLTKWNYCFTYSLPFHYPQDRIYGEVEFNIAQNFRAEASFTDAFAQLAEFVTVFPEVNKDLEGILATIDATIDPKKPDDKKKIDDAAIALKSFVKLVRDVTDAAGTSGLVMRPAEKLFSGTVSLTFSFTLQECSVNVGTTQAALLVALVVTGTLPEGIGKPVVLIDPDNYDYVRYEGQDCDGQDCNQEDRFCFVYKKRGTNDYLTAASGQMIGPREIVLPEMDIFQRQDSWPTIYLKRNEALVPGKQLADEFVYQTPDVKFANPFHPTIDSDVKLSIPCIGSPTPVTRSLQQQLETLFNALLKNNSEPTLTFQVEVNYLYSLSPGLIDPISVPVLMQPPLQVQIAVAGSDTLEQMIVAWANAINLWFSTYTPKKEGGTYLFDIVAMSNLTSEPMPLLRLRNVILPIEYIAS